MSDAEDFATLFAREAARPTLEVGQIVKGRVIQIAAESVFVDVGGKGEAWIERAELTDEEGRLRVAVGDEVEATVVSTGDEVRLSHKLRQGAQARQALAVAAQTGIPVEGKVAAVIKGGYEVTIAGLRAFCGGPGRIRRPRPRVPRRDLRRQRSQSRPLAAAAARRARRRGRRGDAEENRPGRGARRHGDLAGGLRRLRRPRRSAGARAAVRALTFARHPSGRSAAGRRGGDRQGAADRSRERPDLAQPQGPRGRPMGGGAGTAARAPGRPRASGSRHGVRRLRGAAARRGRAPAQHRDSA